MLVVAHTATQPAAVVHSYILVGLSLMCHGMAEGGTPLVQLQHRRGARRRTRRPPVGVFKLMAERYECITIPLPFKQPASHSTSTTKHTSNV